MNAEVLVARGVWGCEERSGVSIERVRMVEWVDGRERRERRREDNS